MIALLILSSLTLTYSLQLSQLQRLEECGKLRSAYQTFCQSPLLNIASFTHQGTPGKRGPGGQKGDKGVMGKRGIKGDAGEVDYDRLESMIDMKLQRVRVEYERNFTEMKRLLADANEEIVRLAKRDICPINYDGKCFWLVSKRQSEWITCSQANELCENRGGKATNIYSGYHHYMIVDYLRNFVGSAGYTDAATGMRYDQKTNSVVLRNGTAASFVRWHPGQPTGAATCLSFIAREPWNHSDQHLYRGQPGRLWRGAICEKNIATCPASNN